MEPEGELNDKASDSKPVGLNRRPESEKVSEPTVCVCVVLTIFILYCYYYIRIIMSVRYDNILEYIMVYCSMFYLSVIFLN